MEPQRVRAGCTYGLSQRVAEVRVTVEWFSTSTTLCDLDLLIEIFDRRAGVVEHIDLRNPISSDKAVRLTADVDIRASQKQSLEYAHIDFERLSADTGALLFYLDGGSRNFDNVASVKLACTRTRVVADVQSIHSVEDAKPLLLCYSTCKSLKQTDCVALGVLSQQHGQWNLCHLHQRLGGLSPTEQQRRLNTMVLDVIPQFEQFKTWEFSSVSSICAALSSRSLPQLKAPFLQSNGLNKEKFTTLLFHQLASNYPRLADPVEAGHCVAMLQEMFSQIDFNDDKTVDWEEFTSFTIQNGLMTLKQTTSEVQDQVKIGYEQISDFVAEKTTSHRLIKRLHYDPHCRRLITVKDEQFLIQLFDLHGISCGVIDAIELQTLTLQGTSSDNQTLSSRAHFTGQFQVYDAIYIMEYDCFALSTSDHDIITCKEHVNLRGHRSYVPSQHIRDTRLHISLVWAQLVKLLCSIANDDSIHGWNLESGEEIFNIVGHHDTVTCLLSIDDLGLLASCSLDKQIALWDMKSRQSKGYLHGHKRGVRTMSYGKGLLLSAGFELDAKTWDVNTRERLLTLRGHRWPICAVHILCEHMPCDEDIRGLTLDDSGEFRVWDIFVEDRKNAVVTFAPVLQVFSLQNLGEPSSRLNSFVCPHDFAHSIDQYSDIIASSCQLFKFNPRRVLNEFIAATAFALNSRTSTINAAIGNQLILYDLCSGKPIRQIIMDGVAEITALCFDQPSQRHLFVGRSNGNLVVLNYSTGATIQNICVHTREVTTVLFHRTAQRSFVFTTGADGTIVSYETVQGQLSVYQIASSVFGDCGIQRAEMAHDQRCLVACSTDRYWGIWDSITLKKRLICTHSQVVSDICVLPTTIIDNQQGMLVAVAANNRLINIYFVDVFMNGAIPLLQLPAYQDTEHGIANADNIEHISSLVFCANAGTSSPVAQSEQTLGTLICCTDRGWITICDIKLPIVSLGKHIQTDGKHPNNGHAAQISHSGISDSFITESRLDNDMSYGGGDVDNPRRSWRGHCDCIVRAVTVGDQGCFMTVSHDGFHRLWNIDGKVLGEIPLPNLTDEMKHARDCLLRMPIWSFTFNRVVVSEAQFALAKDMLLKITKPPYERQQQLQSDVDDHPPLLFASSELVDNSVGGNLRAANSRSPRNKLLATLKEATPVEIEKAEPAYLDANKINSLFTTDAPFSAASILYACSKGVFDTEAHRILTAISRSKEKIRAYERMYPTLMLKDVAASTTVALPKLHESEKAYLLLGTQASYYKNGTTYAKQQLHISTAKARRVMALDQINRAINRTTALTRDKNVDDIAKQDEALVGLLLEADLKVIENDAEQVGTIPPSPMSPRNSNTTWAFRRAQTTPHAERLRPSTSGDRFRRGSRRSKLRQRADKIIESLSVPREQQSPQAQRDNKLGKLVGKMDSIVYSIDSTTTTVRAATSHGSTSTKHAVDKVQIAKILMTRTALQTILACHIRLAKELWPSLRFHELPPSEFAPYYKTEQLIKFRDAFNQIDENMYGHLTLHGWIKFFKLAAISVSDNEIFDLFRHLDMNGDGLISLDELIHVVFFKATTAQRKLMLKTIRDENMRGCMQLGLHISNEQIRVLFSTYGEQNSEYIQSSVVKQKLLELYLPFHTLRELIDQLGTCGENTMISIEQFESMIKNMI